MLAPVRTHAWDSTPAEAVQLQRALASLLDPTDAVEQWHSVAGIDVGLKDGLARAAVVVLSLPDLRMIEYQRAESPVRYPYVPGLLSFREIPVVLQALALLASEPDVLLCDGQGYAHPRRMGLATHLGILLDHPTIGCAKSRLCGTYEEPDPERGSHTWLYEDEEVIGAVVRTRTRVRPLFVSVGHKVSLPTAIDLTLRCGGGYRLPEPTRWAHRVASGEV